MVFLEEKDPFFILFPQVPMKISQDLLSSLWSKPGKVNLPTRLEAEQASAVFVRDPRWKSLTLSCIIRKQPPAWMKGGPTTDDVIQMETEFMSEKKSRVVCQWPQLCCQWFILS